MFKRGIDSMLKPMLISDSVDNLNLAEKLKSPGGLDIVMNEAKGLSVSSASYKEELKGKLRQVLAELG